MPPPNKYGFGASEASIKPEDKDLDMEFSRAAFSEPERIVPK